VIYGDMGHGISERGRINHDKEKTDVSVPGRGRSGALEAAGVRGAGADGDVNSPSDRSVPKELAQKGGAAMRGDGSIFLRGRIWWVAYSFRGHAYQESSGSIDQRDAKKLLRKRLKQVGKPNFVDPAKEEKWTLADMKEKIRLDYERKQNRSFEGVEFAFKHLEAEGAFKFYRVIDITSAEIQKYANNRLKTGVARASINRELAYLRRGFRLMFEAGMISTVPVIKLFDGENVRKGFIGVAEFGALLEKMADEDARDLVEFLYNAGWRSGEGRSLEWSEVDLNSNMIHLPAEKSKSKKPRNLPITGALLDVIERRVKTRRLDCEYVFHRNGRQIKSFRKAFKAAAKEIGYPELLPHDMRRSAVRNFRRSGLSEHEGMALSGHQTDSVYRRYDIISDDDLTQAMNRVQEHLKKEAENRKVVPLKQERA
jgi:integrase